MFKYPCTNRLVYRVQCIYLLASVWLSILHISQCSWHLVKSHTMNDRRNSVIQVFLDPSTSWSMKRECYVICHIREIKTFMSSQGQVPAAGSGYHNFNENAIQFVLNLFTACGHWPIPVKWWGRHLGCIKEPFSIMAHNLLICTLTLERASKRKHGETYENVTVNARHGLSWPHQWPHWKHVSSVIS